MDGRKLKKNILELLKAHEFEKSLDKIGQFPARQAVNPLFSFFYNTDELVRWRSVTAMGVVVARLADHDMESARVIMRRLLWNLNDESGGIGWGSPEAMGEIMARHAGMADEYACLLVSYVNPDGNYIEHPILQRGVLWGLGRLARARPGLVKHAACFLPPFLQSEDAMHRGLASWAAGPLDEASIKPLLRHLLEDNTTIVIFIGARPVEYSVGGLARKALFKTEAV